MAPISTALNILWKYAFNDCLYSIHLSVHSFINSLLNIAVCHTSSVLYFRCKKAQKIHFCSHLTYFKYIVYVTSPVCWLTWHSFPPSLYFKESSRPPHLLSGDLSRSLLLGFWEVFALFDKKDCYIEIFNHIPFFLPRKVMSEPCLLSFNYENNKQHSKDGSTEIY